MSKWKCQLIENALNDPEWDEELNAELCMGDCNNCPHSVIERNELEELIFKICDCFEERELREPKLKFMTHVMDKALEETNKELEEYNFLDFIQLLQEKDHYQEEFNEAIMIFERNLQKHLDQINYDTIKALKEV